MKEIEQPINEEQFGDDAFVPMGFTPKQYSRLQAFEHLLGQVRRYEDVLDTGRTLHWGQVTPEGKVYDTHFIIDREQVQRMKRMAFEMYESDFAGTQLGDVALDIVDSSKERAVEPMSKQRLSELWRAE